ncbi:MAG: hypothetical protein CMH98_09780 [Oceanospirillaceae bacterium]|nr:hypothetical protein [Oceanospirillaceae bacterium]
MSDGAFFQKHHSPARVAFYCHTCDQRYFTDSSVLSPVSPPDRASWLSAALAVTADKSAGGGCAVPVIIAP